MEIDIEGVICHNDPLQIKWTAIRAGKLPYISSTIIKVRQSMEVSLWTKQTPATTNGPSRKMRHFKQRVFHIMSLKKGCHFTILLTSFQCSNLLKFTQTIFDTIASQYNINNVSNVPQIISFTSFLCVLNCINYNDNIYLPWQHCQLSRPPSVKLAGRLFHLSHY